VSASAAGVSGDGVASSLLLLRLVFGIALGLSVVSIAVAAAPPWVLPRAVATVVYERRDSVIFAGISVAVGLCLGLAFTLWSS
jgi:hypothetical protein